MNQNDQREIELLAALYQIRAGCYADHERAMRYPATEESAPRREELWDKLTENIEDQWAVVETLL
jgi:hypothetical protein